MLTSTAIGFFVMVIILASTSMPSNVFALTFHSKINLSNDNDASVSPQIAVDGNHVFVVWEDSTSSPSKILLKMSNDSGSTFTNPQQISNSIDGASDPHIIAVNGAIYIVWTSAANSGDISFRKGTVSDETLNLDPEQSIDSSSDPAANPQLAVSDGHVFIVWEQEVEVGHPDIFYAASFDNGNNFIHNNLSNSSGIISQHAQINATNGNVFITWNEFDSDNTGISDVYFTK